MNFNKNLIVGSIIIGLGLLGIGIYAFYKRQIALVTNFCYKLANLKFINLKIDQVTLDLTVKFKNQSDISVGLSSYNFDVYINGNFITNISSTSDAVILANAVSSLVVRIDFNPSSVFDLQGAGKLLYQALTDKSNFIIEIKGTVSAKINFVKINNFPLDINMCLADILAPSNKDDTMNLQCTIY